MNQANRLLRAGLTLAALLVAAPAGAAGRSIGDELGRVSESLEDAETRIAALSREYGQRRGLIGAEDARRRYEDAVFLFLVSEYEPAALTFFTLVESGSLGATGLQHDSEWYLAESLFELGNWATALEAYNRIIQAGESHPFFEDAVRRQLEVYGLMDDWDAFYASYRQWILSGRVPADEAVKYTVAKSFYRQGEMARAKAMFSEQPSGSRWYARARYFLGTILATEGELGAAAAEFDKVLLPESGASSEVQQLARLALGRVYYEMGRYDDAVKSYQALPTDSPWFADQLYELVWTYIKKEDWQSAIRHVEIFLIAYPEHRYTLQMKLSQGHLHMKTRSFERALAAYEAVVNDYSPLHARLEKLESNRSDPAVFFEGIVRSDTDNLDDDPRTRLPSFAVEMLVEQEPMGRVVDTSREISRQDSDLRGARATLDEISSVLDSTDEAIGTFGRGRQALLRVRDDALQLRHRLLEAEIEFLAGNSDRMTRAEAQGLRAQLDLLATRAQQVQGEESARTDRYQAHEDQVRAVQEEAVKARRLVEDLRDEGVATRRVLDEKRRDMSVDDVELVELELDRIEGALREAARGLEGASSSATLRLVLAAVPRGRSSDTDQQRALLAADYDALHQSLRPYRSDVSADNTPLRDADAMWGRVMLLDTRAADVRGQLESAEVRELALLQEGVRAQMNTVNTLETAVTSVDVETDALAARITQAGFGHLEDQLGSDIMAADMGIVDVYWLRKTQVVSERTQLATERSERLQQLNSRFDLIRQKLEE